MEGLVVLWEEGRLPGGCGKHMSRQIGSNKPDRCCPRGNHGQWGQKAEASCFIIRGVLEGSVLKGVQAENYLKG